jgi:hypothetical protein
MTKTKRKLFSRFWNIKDTSLLQTSANSWLKLQYLPYIFCWFGLNIFIWARSQNKFLQLIFITFESTSRNQPVLVLYEETWSWPNSGLNQWSLGWEADSLSTRPLIFSVQEGKWFQITTTVILQTETHEKA